MFCKKPCCVIWQIIDNWQATCRMYFNGKISVRSLIDKKYRKQLSAEMENDETDGVIEY